MSHTPGPWVVEKTRAKKVGSDIDWLEIAIHHKSSKGERVAVVYGDPDDEAKYKANTRLVVAAPDMYDFLKSLPNVLAEDPWTRKTLERAREIVEKIDGKK